VAQHKGVERRLEQPYFKDRTERTSQGDIFEDVPVERAVVDAEGAVKITSEEAMVVSPASCLIDNKTSQLMIAPVYGIERLGISQAVVGEIRTYDCHHEVMYLPAEGERSERVVDLRHMQPINRGILEACDRQSQLSAYATRLLMRKLALYQSGNHLPSWVFDLRSDDFPGEEHADEPQPD
jgi:hypothetical protein